MDIGSSPGGWTSYLASAGCELVLSIDPGDLLIPLVPPIVHIQKKVEDSTAELSLHAPYNLCVCDMNGYSLASVHCILSLLPHLTAGAPVILTVKEMQAGHSKRLQAGAMDLLRCGFEGLRCHFLLANGRERTLVGWRKERTEGEAAEVQAVLQRVEQEMKVELESIKAKSLRVTEAGQHFKMGKYGKKFLRGQRKAEMLAQHAAEMAAGEGGPRVAAGGNVEECLGLAASETEVG